MSYPATMAYIVLPQAFRNMVPMLLTQTIILFQDTSLVYVISVTDFLGAASKVAQARRAAGRDVSVRCGRLFRHFVSRLARWCNGCSGASPSSAKTAMIT